MHNCPEQIFSSNGFLNLLRKKTGSICQSVRKSITIGVYDAAFSISRRAVRTSCARHKKVALNKPKRGGTKKFYVYTKNKKGNVIKVSFGADSGGGKLAVKLKDPKARKAFADRHNCEKKNDKTKAGYWSCRLPRYAKSLGLSGGGTWW